MKFFSLLLAAAVAGVAAADCSKSGCSLTENGPKCCSGYHCLHTKGPGVNGPPIYKCVKN